MTDVGQSETSAEWRVVLKDGDGLVMDVYAEGSDRLTLIRAFREALGEQQGRPYTEAVLQKRQVTPWEDIDV